MKNALIAAAFLGSLASAAPGRPWHPMHYGPPHYGSGGSSGAPSASIKNGTVAGVHSSNYNQDFFLGVPFAQPPVGDLRFRNPQSLNSTYNGTLEATSYASECVGYGGDQIGYPVSEDCLYLNVIRPSGYENEELPVGVWIHGGGLYMGGAVDERYNLSFIVQNSVEIGKPIIGVSIAYRLSGWGFLASQEVTGSGNTNIGVRDQRLALHWIQENIGGFGGDASKVTIWGESAGAESVGFHLTAYNGRDDKLFRAGIMESGNPVSYNSYRTVEQYQLLYDALVSTVGCGNATDNLECLRQAPFEAINAVFNTSEASEWQPIIDGDILARWASIQLAEGDFVKVPIIDGANTDEGTSFGPVGVNTTAQFIADITSNETQAFLPDFLGAEAAAAYPNECDYYIPPPSEISCNASYPSSFGELYRRTSAYFGDVVMIANRRGACQTWTSNGVDAYCYRFDTRPAGVPWYLGVPHFQEVAFVFDNTMGVGYNAEHGTMNPFQDKPQAYLDLAELMSKSWASFIYDQDPNGWTGRHVGTPDWPVYNNGSPQDMVFDANSTELAYPEADTFRQTGIQWILDHATAYRR